jgi:hypothetical protein
MRKAARLIHQCAQHVPAKALSPNKKIPVTRKKFFQFDTISPQNPTARANHDASVLFSTTCQLNVPEPIFVLSRRIAAMFVAGTSTHLF